MFFGKPACRSYLQLYQFNQECLILYKLYFLYLPSASTEKDYRAAYREWALSRASMKEPYITGT